jgi:hypothetical protein
MILLFRSMDTSARNRYEYSSTNKNFHRQWTNWSNGGRGLSLITGLLPNTGLFWKTPWAIGNWKSKWPPQLPKGWKIIILHFKAEASRHMLCQSSGNLTLFAWSPLTRRAACVRTGGRESRFIGMESWTWRCEPGQIGTTERPEPCYPCDEVRLHRHVMCRP